MASTTDLLPPIGAILSGLHWPSRVRVVRIEPPGTARVLIEVATLDTPRAAHLPHPLLHRARQPPRRGGNESFHVERRPGRLSPSRKATRIRLAYTHDPLFAASVARIGPLPHQLEAVYHYMLRQPWLRFLLADDPGAGKTIKLSIDNDAQHGQQGPHFVDLEGADGDSQ